MKRKFTLLLSMLLLLGMGSSWATKIQIDWSKVVLNSGENSSWDATSRTFSWTSATHASLDLKLSGNFRGYYIAVVSPNSTADNKYKLIINGTSEQTFNNAGSVKMWNLNQNDVTSIYLAGNTTSGSIVLEDIYLITENAFERPEYNSDGTYTLPLGNVKASGCYSTSITDGVMTVTKAKGAYGSLYIEIPAEGFNLADGFNMTVDVNSTIAWDDSKLGTLNLLFLSGSTATTQLHASGFGGSKFGLKIDKDNNNTYLSNCNKIVRIYWNAGNSDAEGSFTIKSVKFTTPEYNLIKVSTDIPSIIEMSSIKKSDYGNGEVGSYVNIIGGSESSTNVWGDTNVSKDNYNDYSNSSYTTITVTGGAPNATLRFIFNREEGTLTQKTSFDDIDASATDVDFRLTLDATGAGEFNFSKLTTRRLNSIKYTSSNVAPKEITISNGVYSTNVLTDGFVLSTSAQTVLNDESLTSIDATQLTNTSIALTTANPNCLIYAESGKVSNANNVIVDGTCANLVLTDAKPFKAPMAFTATNATFSKTVNAAGASTMVLPFAVTTLPEGVEAYKLIGVADGKATVGSVTSIDANQPVLLNKAGDYNFTATSAAIAATGGDPVNGNGILYGVYASQYVPADSYVLQDGANGLGFYKVAADNTININPFRAYLTDSAAGARSYIGFDIDDELTGIKSVDGSGLKVQGADTYYDLSGRRVAQPTKGLYIVNGKKYIVK